MKAVIGKQYRHYKGDPYTVITIGEHTETNQELVVYRQECENKNGLIGKVWIRPKIMWESSVVWQDTKVQRFTMIDNQ